jgi:hypothetical protein
LSPYCCVCVCVCSINALQALARELDEGLGSHVEEFARELDGDGNVLGDADGEGDGDGDCDGEDYGFDDMSEGDADEDASPKKGGAK